MTPTARPPLVFWKDAPEGRGTSNVLWLCVSTLLICVWSALHMDVPKHKRFWSGLLTRCGWLFVGLLMPEVLVLVALGQLIDARRLVADAERYLPCSTPVVMPWWQRLLRHDTSPMRGPPRALHQRIKNTEESPPLVLTRLVRAGSHDSGDLNRSDDPSKPAPQRRHPWTFTHSFYTVMGGFVLETCPGEPFLPFQDYDTRIALTADGMRYLMEHAPELVPDVPADDIADRSKASALAKAILCIQLLVFCISCAARIDQRLPLSLLEITTLAHCLCTLVAYALWWAKPQDVGAPTLISGERARELGALLFMSGQSYYMFPIFSWAACVVPSELECLQVSPCSETEAAADLARVPGDPQQTLPFSEDARFLGFAPKADTAQKDFSISFSDFFGRLVGIPFPSANWAWFQRRSRTQQQQQRAWTLNRRDIARLAIARNALDSYPMPTVARAAGWDAPRPFVVPEQQLSRGLLSATPAHAALAALAFAVLYGLPHLLGLREEFPSAGERVAWSVATYVVVGSPVLLSVSFALNEALRGQQYSVRDILPRVGQWSMFVRIPVVLLLAPVALLGFVLVAVFVLSPALYSLSSPFLMLESFRQLFALPDGVFQQPQLTRYLPHFS